LGASISDVGVPFKAFIDVVYSMASSSNKEPLKTEDFAFDYGSDADFEVIEGQL